MDTTSWIMDERKAAESELRALLGNEPLLDRQQEGLVDPTIVLVLHPLIGVISGFLGRQLYDKWKECTTRRQLTDLAGEMARAPASTEAVDEQVIRRDVVKVLTQEGLSPAHAEYLTERVVTRVKSRFAKGRSSGGES